MGQAADHAEQDQQQAVDVGERSPTCSRLAVTIRATSEGPEDERDPARDRLDHREVVFFFVFALLLAGGFLVGSHVGPSSAGWTARAKGIRRHRWTMALSLSSPVR